MVLPAADSRIKRFTRVEARSIGLVVVTAGLWRPLAASASRRYVGSPAFAPGGRVSPLLGDCQRRFAVEDVADDRDATKLPTSSPSGDHVAVLYRNSPAPARVTIPAVTVAMVANARRGGVIVRRVVVVRRKRKKKASPRYSLAEREEDSVCRSWPSNVVNLRCSEDKKFSDSDGSPTAPSCCKS